MLVLITSFVCSVLFSFLYQLTNMTQLKFNYLTMRSKCDYCDSKLQWFVLIPILSFFILRGNTACCHNKLKRHYIIGECLSFILIPIIIYFGVQVHLSLFITTYLFLLTMALYDIETLSINVFMLILFAIVCTAHSIFYFSTFIIFFFILHVFYFLSPKHIGYGDILLLTILSCFFPYHFYVIFLLFTLFIAIIVSSVLLITKQQTYIPFVPFMFIGFIFASCLYHSTLMYL
ncbi:prepilin peptidase [Staphylococcus borealis]|uniref:prepilin peptidase n=1 Tax=Staphylococcus borealis TaxID=2742203 RepID=UPI000FF04BDD|nr:prepilin peptidase [Staphylococcus haemolyticus]